MSDLVPHLGATLCAQFRSTVEQVPTRIALHHRGRDLTYGELGRRARVFARWLETQGVSSGERIAIVLPNTADYLVAYYGILLAGGCAVALNPESAPEEIVRILDHCEASGAIVTPKISRILLSSSPPPNALKCLLISDPSEPQTPHDEITSLGSVVSEGDAVWPTGVSTEDLAQIIYTSGTTGRSKGVTLQHRALAANCRSIVSYLRLAATDAVFVTLPFFYSYGTSLLITHVAVGGRLVLANDFVFLGRALDLMRDQEATGFSGVPSSFAMLIHTSDFLRRSFPALRYMTCAGGALAPETITSIQRAFPGVEYYSMYGQTEASARLSTLLPNELDSHLGSIGRGIPGVELLVADEDGRPVPAGVIGEIVARGENLMLGYWKDAEATARVLRPEGLRTGDLARTDVDGYIYIVGRKSDIIKSGAYRIGPQDIEEVMLQCEDVVEVAVVGRPDRILGEVPVAFVVLRQHGNAPLPPELLQFANERLPRYMALREVRIVDSLPKTASGKVLRKSLRERLVASPLP